MNKFKKSVYRYAKVLKSDGKWHLVNFDSLKEGDIFKLYEPDGKLVKDKKKNFVFKAKSDAFKIKNSDNSSIETELLK